MSNALRGGGVPPRRHHRGSIVGLLAVGVLLLTACLPMPPGSFNEHQFPPGVGPDLVRATTFRGSGVWWDMYDWSPTMTGGRPAVGLGDLDFYKANGVQVVYVQTATFRRPETILDPATLKAVVQRAHQLEMRVVGWYLPQFLDVNTDSHRLAQIAYLGVDGIAIDIEALDNPDVSSRNAALIQITQNLRGAHPNLPLGAITQSPVAMDIVSGGTFWPRFPWQTLVRYYDAFLPMAYYTFRTPESGYRDAYRYVAESVTRTRANTGVAWLPVHPVGGLAELTSPADMAGMNQAIIDTYAIGGSFYDARTTAWWVWPYLRAFNH